MLQEIHAIHSHLNSMGIIIFQVHLNDIHWEENVWPSIDALIKSAKRLVALLNVDSLALVWLSWSWWAFLEESQVFCLFSPSTRLHGMMMMMTISPTFHLHLSFSPCCILDGIDFSDEDSFFFLWVPDKFHISWIVQTAIMMVGPDEWTVWGPQTHACTVSADGPHLNFTLQLWWLWDRISIYLFIFLLHWAIELTYRWYSTMSLREDHGKKRERERGREAPSRRHGPRYIQSFVVPSSFEEHYCNGCGASGLSFSFWCIIMDVWT